MKCSKQMNQDSKLSFPSSILNFRNYFPTAMQLGFNLWAWTWCNISRPRKSGTLGGGTGGTCGTHCPGTFAFLELKEFLEPVEPVKRMGFHRFQAFLGFKHAWFHRFHTGSAQVPHRFHTGSQVPWVQPGHWFDRFQTGSLGSTVELWELWRV